MPRSPVLASLAAAAFLVFHVAGAAEPASPLARQPEVAAAIRVLDAWITRTASDREQPGLSIGIVHDQELVWAKGYGMADLARKRPATPSTAYRIASLSKLFTATAILQLRDAGRLQLDDPVTKYLPEFQPGGRFPDAPVITIRQLLSHTSGLPREVSGGYWNDLKFPDAAEMMRLLNAEGPALASETEWKYSNVALSLAGEIVEKASGEPYARYIERRVLAPLGMTSTRVEPAADAPALAVGYGRRVPGKPRRVEGFLSANFMVPAASFASTVEDLARFAFLQFRSGAAAGAQILRGSTLAEMQRVQWLAPDWTHGWGLGWGVRRVGEQIRISHGGSVPGHRTQITLVPAEKLGVVVLTNAEDGQPGRYVSTALGIVGPALRHAAAPPPVAPARADAAWAKYAGRYVWEDDEAFVMVLNGELVMIDPSDDDPWESRVRLEAAGPDTFQMKSGDQIGELIHFEADASGRITRLSAPGYFLDRQDTPPTSP
ncbi:MAG: serine hydrolase domain-containing protein [Acidobacteriota bacterium]